MDKGKIVRLTGAHVEETAKVLGRRIVELGGRAEMLDAVAAERLGGPDGAAFAARLLVRNGVVVIATYAEAQAEGPQLDVEVADHDTPDFAAEKVLDDLAEEGGVDIESSDYSPEEEERIRERLADLGYIE